jgi:hypothetical protein
MAGYRAVRVAGWAIYPGNAGSIKGGCSMTVTIVTTRKGTADTIIAAAKKSKPVWAKHGAESYALNFIATGPDSGQWSLVIRFANWEKFGKSMQSASADPAFTEAQAAIDASS